MEDAKVFLEGRRIYRVVNGSLEEIDLEQALRELGGKTIVGSLVYLDGLRATPTIRIVYSSDKEHLALDTLAVFKRFLDSYSASCSSYVVRTPRYYELRLNERGLSLGTSGVSGLELAKVVASFLLSALESKLKRVSMVSGGAVKFLNVAAIEENPVLVAPMTRVDNGRAEFMHLEEIDSVLSPSEFHHSSKWCEYKEGSLDKLVKEALSRTRSVVASIEAKGIARSLPKVVGRFEVMALLQAARYYVLTGDLEKAKSFGLNRAIFYAWAKYYGPRGRPWASYAVRRGRGGGVEREEPLLDEVPKSPRGYFVMDGKEQLPQDFDRQVRTKFESLIPWEIVWRRALAYVKMFPQETLRDPNRFFKYVYEPVRDVFLERVVLSSVSSMPKSVGMQMKRTSRGESKSVSKPIRRLTDFVSDNSSKSN